MANQIASKTYNHDIVGYLQRILRFRFELLKSASGGMSEMSQYDQDRLSTYLDACTKYLDWVMGQPELDLPESHPREYELPQLPEYVPVENESVNDVLRMLDVHAIEVSHSQSGLRASRMIDFDEKRARDMIAKIRAFLADYIATTTPLDLPESSPRAEAAGAGRGNFSGA